MSFLDTPCFALLDDCAAEGAARRSRLYSRHVGTLRCEQLAQWPVFLDALQQALQKGQFAVMAAHYELGAAMQGVAVRDAVPPLAQVWLFACCHYMTRDEVDAWLVQQEKAQPAGIFNFEHDTHRAAFEAAMARIHAYIEAGDVYQVNYTYRLRFHVFGSVFALYAALRLRQPVPYGALIGLPDGSAILSFSPELFMRHHAGDLTVQPMKGTAAASDHATGDALLAQALVSDEKNRAENLMIVDLLRNDLGRVAQVGSVKVKHLFDVARFGNVLQMTSTVTARLDKKATLGDIFSALYPCGSITGAPKLRAMQIIRELELHARGIYTGALGWFDPPVDSSLTLGNFCLSVPIRTLKLAAKGKGKYETYRGIRYGEMGVGAGIVHDSATEDEYAECLLKADFLRNAPCAFKLFETMRVAARQVAWLSRHVQRLRGSADFFGFVFDEAHLYAELAAWCAALPDDGVYRVRITLAQDGHLAFSGAPLIPLVLPVKLLLAPETMRADDLFLRHKTTVRDGYDRAWQKAEGVGAFDCLFFNEQGELTEGARSSVFIRHGKKWLTPSLKAGLLPGVMRSVMLDDPVWQAKECVLRRDDLFCAEEIMVCNALRGILPAVLMDENVIKETKENQAGKMT